MSGGTSTSKGCEDRLVEVRLRRWRRKHEKTLHEMSDTIWENPGGHPNDINWYRWAEAYVKESAEFMQQLSREMLKVSVECYGHFGEAEAASAVQRCERELSAVRRQATDEVSRRFEDERISWTHPDPYQLECWLDRLEHISREILEEAKDAIEEERLWRLVRDGSPKPPGDGAAAGACPGAAPKPERPPRGQVSRSAAPGTEAAVAVHVRGGHQGAMIGKVSSVVLNIGPDEEAQEAAPNEAAAPAPAGEDRVGNRNDVERVSARVEALERRFASRLDLSQFGALSIRQVVAVAGQELDQAARRCWRRKCAGCALPGRRKRGARIHYDPWGVARVMESEGIVPRWGAAAVQHCAQLVARARKLSASQRESLDGLLAGWLASYLVPGAFKGVRDETDREDIKAQIALFVAQHVGEGRGALTRDEFDEAVGRAEAQAVGWWRREILRSRNRENRTPARGNGGADFTGELDGFTDDEADGASDADVNE